MRGFFSRSFWESGRAVWVAGGLWLVLTMVLTVMVVLKRGERTVTGNYRLAAEKWAVSDRSVYENPISGFLYFPQGAMVFMPFTWLPLAVGEVLWRYAAIALVLTGLWRVAQAGREMGWPSLWALMAVLALPACLASARNGQTNLHLVGLFLHVGVDLYRGKNGRAALGLCVALALKPIALVPILLAGALFPKLRLKLASGLIIFLLLPFVRFDPGYAWEMTGACLEKLKTSSQPDYHDFCDLEGMFRTWGMEGPAWLWTGIRALMAPITLAFAWMSLRRLGGPLGPLAVMIWGAWYLVLFNPRTEANSYALLGPWVAVAAAWAWSQKEKGFGVGLLIFLALALGCDSYGNPIHPWTNLWFKAVIALTFGGWMVWAWVARRPGKIRTSD